MNPFKRTMAVDKSTGKPGPGVDSRTNQKEPLQGQQAATARPQYDVDDFKRLLLTGQTSNLGSDAANPPRVEPQTQGSIGDNNSNTDSSSVSRQSIFESGTGTVQGLLQESPGTSENSSILDDTRQQSTAGHVPIPSKPKPPAPRHRHGKPVKLNVPQTVAFEDPDLTFAALDSTSPLSPSLSQSVKQSKEAEKPLLRSSPITGEGGLAENASGKQNLPLRRLGQESITTSQKPAPPEVPLSRRHSQLRSTAATISERSFVAPQETGIQQSSSSRSRSNSGTKVPPTPPPRRSQGLTRVGSSSSVSSSSSFPQFHSQQHAEDIPPSSMKPRPSAPPTYSPTISSFKRHQTQPLSSSPPMPPPPPPPRRRGSSQSSYNPSRLSGDYRTAASERLRSDSGASSVSQRQSTSATPSSDSASNKDVMADISALQREVDELRGKFKD